MSDHDAMQGWRADELESVAACPACGTKADGYRHRHLHDHLENVPGHWDLRACHRCHSLFLDPRPTPESIGKAYASYYTHGSGALAHADDNGRSLFWKLANGYMNARYGPQRSPALAVGRVALPMVLPLRQQLDYFYRHLPRTPGRLLDVGCGNGVFLLRAKAACWKVMGLEPDPVAAAAARESGLTVQQGTLDGFSDSVAYDVVCASHVIEHVPDPRRFMQQAFGLLRAGGMAWLATPNVQGMGHRWFGSSWRGLEPPRHLTLFSAQALRGLLVGAGFAAVRFHRRGRGAGYMLRTSRELARCNGIDVRMLPPGLIDLCATIAPTAAEELVVTARKPRS